MTPAGSAQCVSELPLIKASVAEASETLDRVRWLSRRGIVLVDADMPSVEHLVLPSTHLCPLHELFADGVRIDGVDGDSAEDGDVERLAMPAEVRPDRRPDRVLIGLLPETDQHALRWNQQETRLLVERNDGHVVEDVVRDIHAGIVLDDLRGVLRDVAHSSLLEPETAPIQMNGSLSRLISRHNAIHLVYIGISFPKLSKCK